jgi:hypothetical protein
MEAVVEPRKPMVGSVAACPVRAVSGHAAEKRKFDEVAPSH